MLEKRSFAHENDNMSVCPSSPNGGTKFDFDDKRPLLVASVIGAAFTGVCNFDWRRRHSVD